MHRQGGETGETQRTDGSINQDVPPNARPSDRFDPCRARPLRGNQSDQIQRSGCVCIRLANNAVNGHICHPLLLYCSLPLKTTHILVWQQASHHGTPRKISWYAPVKETPRCLTPHTHCCSLNPSHFVGFDATMQACNPGLGRCRAL
jgi:hypothetical protein